MKEILCGLGIAVCDSLSGREAVAKARKQVLLCIGSESVHLNLRCTLLRQHGWTVLSSGSGYEGVEVFRQEKVDAVVLDLDGDGSQSALIAAELKRQKPHIPIIMVVDDRAQWVPDATAQAGAVILKKEEPGRLHLALEKLLNGSKPA
jgi:DNA-binding NarL/FixJ family response regulator